MRARAPWASWAWALGPAVLGPAFLRAILTRGVGQVAGRGDLDLLERGVGGGGRDRGIVVSSVVSGMALGQGR